MVQEIAQTYEQPDAVVRWHYEKPERLNEFEAHRRRAQRGRMGARQGAGQGRAHVVRGADDGPVDQAIEAHGPPMIAAARASTAGAA